MGGTGFTTEVIAAETVDKAYSTVYADARAEFGSDGYNGTISTTSGFRQVVQIPMTAAGARLYADAHWEDANKWEDALAIPVADGEHFTFKTVKLTVTVDPVDESGRPRTLREYDVREAAIEKSILEYGCTVHNVAVTPKIKNKTVVTNATGRATTKYEITGGSGRGQLFDTKAQAVAAAKKIVSGEYANNKVSIRAVKFYPETNSADAAVIRTETVEAKGVATVTLAVPKKPHNTPVAGWIFFGIAAC
jgi:hypothetical protein